MATSSQARSFASSRAPEKRPPFDAPVRAWALAEWALMPLRLFLGLTFIYASLQKLSNPNFFNAKSPISIQNQLIASERVSPIHALLTHLNGAAVLIGLLMALGELAVGVGALFGLWTRAAAIGGAIINFSLFLTVSFHATPYFTGSDIVFFFAWIPLIIAGGGSRWSLDAAIARTVARAEHQPTPELVALPFARVQQLCGHFQKGRCAARAGAECDAGLCPVLTGKDQATPIPLESIKRRTVVRGAAAVAGMGAASVVTAGAIAGVARLMGRAASSSSTNQLSATTTTTTSSGTSSTTTTQAHSSSTGTTKGTLLGNISQVPSGEAAQFTIPSSGDPGIIVHADGTIFCYDAVCPHAGCTVGYASSQKMFVCPCHGSEFNLQTGDVLNGPAPRGLTPLKVVEGSNGNLYLQ